MSQNPLVAQMSVSKEYFDRSTRCFTEADSGFAPKEGMLTVAGHIAHVAQTVEWFLEGAFRPEGFDLDFERFDAEVRQVTSLAEARARLDRAFANAARVLGEKSAADLEAALPEGPIMGGLPRAAIVPALADHTAHHRGALTVYARHCGHVPAMPYMEM